MAALFRCWEFRCWTIEASSIVHLWRHADPEDAVLRDYLRNWCMPINVHPMIINTPPMGVTAPSLRNAGEMSSLRAKNHKETLKMKAPRMVILMYIPLVQGALPEMAMNPRPLSAKYSDAVFQTSR